MADRTTRIPDVVDGLLELFGTLRPAEPPHESGLVLQILDGPVIGELLQNVVLVGMPRSQDGQGYDVALERMEGYGRPRYEEQWTIGCWLSLSTGDSSPTIVRELRHLAGGIFADMDTLLRDHQTNGDAWQRAALGAESAWLPMRHEGGTNMDVFFDVVGASLL